MVRVFVLRKGSQGSNVNQLQHNINLYYKKDVLDVDGVFGPMTDFYVREIQNELGVLVDGIFGPVTSSKLNMVLTNRNKIIGSMPIGLYPPFAHVLKQRMKTRGKYQAGGPRGAIVHFTAGRDGAEKTINGGIENGYAFWTIQRDGKLFCAHPYNEWGYHAGESKWSHLAKKLVGSVSDDLIGIENNAAGLLTPVKNKPSFYKSWFNTEISDEEVRYTKGIDNQMKGYYHTLTNAQEDTLTETLIWLKFREPDIFDFDFVLGHDEVSGKSGLGYWRKNDPGAALSMTMPKYREKLKMIYNERVFNANK